MFFSSEGRDNEVVRPKVGVFLLTLLYTVLQDSKMVFSRETQVSFLPPFLNSSSRCRQIGTKAALLHSSGLSSFRIILDARGSFPYGNVCTSLKTRICFKLICTILSPGSLSYNPSGKEEFAFFSCPTWLTHHSSNTSSSELVHGTSMEA